MPELSIIIVNWNCGDLLARCIASVEANPPNLSFEIIVIDNASIDDSYRFLENEKKSRGSATVTLIKNQENRGFAKASNQGIRLSHAPLLFLLNPDTEVKPGAIDALVAALQSEARAGMSAPRLLNSDGSLQPSIWPALPDFLYCFLFDLQFYRLLPKRTRGELLLGGFWDHDRRREVKSITGAALMVKRDLIESAGGYNEQYHMYGEDIEWQIRIDRAGWKMIFEPAAEIIHHSGQSAIKRWTDAEIRIRKVEALLRLQRDCYSPMHVMLSTLARTFTFSIIRVKRRMANQDYHYLDEMIRLQLSYFKLSVSDLFVIRRDAT